MQKKNPKTKDLKKLNRKEVRPMSSLKELLILTAAIEQRLYENEGELTEELEAEMLITDAAMSDKIDAYCLVIDKLAQGIDYHNAKLKEHDAIVTRLEKTRERLKDALSSAINTLGVEFLKGNEFLVKHRANPPKVDVTNEDEIPAEYIQTKLTKSVDKKKLGEGLKLGVQIPGARLLQSQRVDIKTRTDFVTDTKERNKLIYNQ